MAKIHRNVGFRLISASLTPGDWAAADLLKELRGNVPLMLLMH